VPYLAFHSLQVGEQAVKKILQLPSMPEQMRSWQLQYFTLAYIASAISRVISIEVAIQCAPLAAAKAEYVHDNRALT
jgi:hypothetical protein